MKDAGLRMINLHGELVEPFFDPLKGLRVICWKGSELMWCCVCGSVAILVESAPIVLGVKLSSLLYSPSKRRQDLN